MIDQLKAKLPHDPGCPGRDLPDGVASPLPCNCTRREILEWVEGLETKARAHDKFGKSYNAFMNEQSHE